MTNVKDLDQLGSTIKITNSSDPSKIGICGLIINETRELLTLRTKTNRIITIKKKEILNLEKIRDIK